MRTLLHFWLSPASRKARIALAEKGLEFELKVERTWEWRSEFLTLNPSGTVPVLIEPDGTTIAEGQPICEYLEDVHPERPLLGDDPVTRAEVRRLVVWFDDKFGREVTENLVGEKVMRRLQRQGEPHAPSVRAGHANLHYHLDYLAFLSERRKWLAGDFFSLADAAAAAHLSAVDYLGDVPWDEHPDARDWYARVKSRPSFRPLLVDHVPGVAPAAHYADLDF